MLYFPPLADFPMIDLGPLPAEWLSLRKEERVRNGTHNGLYNTLFL